MFTSFVEASLNIKPPLGWETRWIRGSGWCPSRAHNDFMEKALEWGADMICILGSDQIHEPDILSRLLARHDEGCEVIGALVPARVSFDGHVVGDRLAWTREGNEPVLIDPEAAALQKISFIGSGVLMFPAGLLEKIKKPWLSDVLVGDNGQRQPNADCFFTWRLQSEAGAQMWVDTTIKVKHCQVFEIDETFPDRFSDQSGKGEERYMLR